MTEVVLNPPKSQADQRTTTTDVQPTTAMRVDPNKNYRISPAADHRETAAILAAITTFRHETAPVLSAPSESDQWTTTARLERASVTEYQFGAGFRHQWLDHNS